MMNCLYCGDYGCEECSSFDVESSRMYLELKAQLKASQTIIKEAHDKLLNVNAVSWEETAWEVKELLKIREVKR
jgi:hypothetical protein